MPHPLNIIRSRYFTSIRCTPAHPTCTIQSVINLPICVIPSHLLDDITSHSFYPIVKWLFSSFLPFVAFRIPRNLLPFLPFFPYNYIPINLLCGCFLSFFPPPFFPSFQSIVAVGSTHVTKDPSPITASIFNNVNGGLHTHTCITHAHLHVYYLYNRHGMYTYMSTYLPPPPPLLSLHYIDMLFTHPYSFILSTAGFYLPNYRAVTNPTIFITYEVIRAINDL